MGGLPGEAQVRCQAGVNRQVAQNIAANSYALGREARRGQFARRIFSPH